MFFKSYIFFFQFSAKSIDQEIDMATNETSSTKTESKTEDSVDSAKNQTKVTFEKNLVSQENRTRIAFLEMQQAELETEIRLLKQNGKNICFRCLTAILAIFRLVKSIRPTFPQSTIDFVLTDKIFPVLKLN